MKRYRVQEPCTVLLVAINVIVFFVLSFQGMTEDGRFMLDHGAMYVPEMLESGEYYRLFTSMFMHFGFPHLVNNMLILIVMGTILERELGTGKVYIRISAQWIRRKRFIRNVGYLDL